MLYRLLSITHLVGIYPPRDPNWNDTAFAFENLVSQTQEVQGRYIPINGGYVFFSNMPTIEFYVPPFLNRYEHPQVWELLYSERIPDGQIKVQ